MDNIAERFGIGAGSVITWKGEWWYKAVESLIAPGISKKIINDLTYRAMRGSLLNFYTFSRTFRAGGV